MDDTFLQALASGGFQIEEYALSEFKGIIIGVFKINNWYAAAAENNKINKR
jgi:hypothetical protein